MRCDDIDELLSAYADGQTVRAQSEFIELHLATCRRCQERLQQYRNVRRVLASALDDRWTPPDLSNRIALAYRRRERSRSRGIGLVGLVAALALTIAIIGFQALGPSATQSGQQLPTTPSAAAVTATFSPQPARISTSPKRCLHQLPRIALARCLGVSSYLAPTVLVAEALGTVSTTGSASADDSSPDDSSALKGGGARSSDHTHRGMQAV